ncbi:MAG: branched-chain amino acid ABC transporter permease [Turicibacter sp.]|nr:branched-chain amino acid ABC transporter permease [Turicibacter sp.]
MFIQQLVNGLALGMVYALIAVGFSLVFGILRLVNFSHAAIFAFGAHVALFFIGLEVGPIPAILISMVLTGGVGILIDKVALAPLRKKKSIPIAGLITTIGVSYILQNILTIVFGSGRVHFPAIIPPGGFDFLGTRITSMQILMFGVSLTLMLLLTYLVNHTKMGLAMRAMQQNPKAARLMGINVNSVIMFTFFLAGATASIAGGLISGFYQMAYPAMGVSFGPKVFSATVLGGIGSMPGAFVGGILIGVIEVMAAMFLGSAYRDGAAFVVLILVLILRPQGLFGRKLALKV